MKERFNTLLWARHAVANAVDLATWPPLLATSLVAVVRRLYPIPPAKPGLDPSEVESEGPASAGAHGLSVPALCRFHLLPGALDPRPATHQRRWFRPSVRRHQYSAPSRCAMPHMEDLLIQRRDYAVAFPDFSTRRHLHKALVDDARRAVECRSPRRSIHSLPYLRSPVPCATSKLQEACK